MTEVHCYSTMNPMHGERRPGSVGLRLPYTEVRVADVAGDGTIRGDCPLGTIGHVLMRGPQVTPGYLDPRHDRGAMLSDGWLDSGDLGRLDKDGYLWLTGRSKDLIIRGGHNIDRSSSRRRWCAIPRSRPPRRSACPTPMPASCRWPSCSSAPAPRRRPTSCASSPQGNPRARRRAGAGHADPADAAHRRRQDLQAGAAPRRGPLRLRRRAGAAQGRRRNRRRHRPQRRHPRHARRGAGRAAARAIRWSSAAPSCWAASRSATSSNDEAQRRHPRLSLARRAGAFLVHPGGPFWKNKTKAPGRSPRARSIPTRSADGCAARIPRRDEPGAGRRLSSSSTRSQSPAARRSWSGRSSATSTHRR